MGLLDVLNGMQNGPGGYRAPSGSTGGGGMSPMTMALLGLLAYKALKSSGGLGGILGGAPAGAARPTGLPPGVSPGSAGGGVSLSPVVMLCSGCAAVTCRAAWLWPPDCDAGRR